MRKNASCTSVRVAQRFASGRYDVEDDAKFSEDPPDVQPPECTDVTLEARLAGEEVDPARTTAMLPHTARPQSHTVSGRKIDRNPGTFSYFPD